jgi:hypothetical protein
VYGSRSYPVAGFGIGVETADYIAREVINLYAYRSVS